MKKISIFTILTALLLLPHSAFAATVKIVPEDTNPNSSSISVSIMMEDVQNLGAAEFRLCYNPDVLSVESKNDIAAGDFLGSTGRNVTTLPQNIDNKAGKVIFGAFTFGNAEGASGKGELAKITFTVKGNTAESMLVLDHLKIADTKGKAISASGGSTVISTK